ncbi:hypothetical protein DPMN_151280 [Dreissena polymorpha]|uniref:Uncharacterized protein n=1 Tax=Dreissena polymorpha TaxID=45954 RepID=A0A9D4FER7_DREPO|nr:hypothetical protein DPMN_151280 [Dreissena polymorpha]
MLVPGKSLRRGWSISYAVASLILEKDINDWRMPKGSNCCVEFDLMCANGRYRPDNSSKITHANLNLKIVMSMLSSLFLSGSSTVGSKCPIIDFGTRQSTKDPTIRP